MSGLKKWLRNPWLNVVFGSEPMRVSTFWLRDNCKCPECFHESTQQRIQRSGDIRRAASIYAVLEDDEENLKLKWSDRHLSTFNKKWLKQMITNAPHPTLKPFTLWLAEEYIEKDHPKLSFNDYMNDTASFNQVCQQLYDYGLVVLKDVPIGTDGDGRPTGDDTGIRSVLNRIGNIRNTFYGETWDVKSVPDSKNIAYTNLFLGVHMDLMYFEAPPGIQALHCIENTVDGGESLFLDVFKVIERFKEDCPHDYQVLTKFPVLYHYNNAGKHYRFTRPIINERPLAEIPGLLDVFYSPPFQGPLEHSHRVNRFYHAIEAFEEILDLPEYTFTFRLKPGECVLFNNRRVLHGRKAFDPETGNRHLKGSYLDYDDFLNVIRLMNKQG
jgi:trimethyllysine dioxygenase